jgi:hypothetical protein
MQNHPNLDPADNLKFKIDVMKKDSNVPFLFLNCNFEFFSLNFELKGDFHEHTH